jgi:uncharacterized protein YndB with AHSA1/START domain
MQKENKRTSDEVLTITYDFNAPRKLVFDAYAHAESLAEWWGPAGYKLTVVKLDFRPKGLFLYKMEAPERVMWGRFIYGQIIKPELIEFTLSFSDEHGGITRAPFFNPWPLEIFNELRLVEKNGKTTITLKSFPLNATKDELASFKTNKHSFREGTTATMDELTVYLSKQLSHG